MHINLMYNENIYLAMINLRNEIHNSIDGYFDRIRVYLSSRDAPKYQIAIGQVFNNTKLINTIMEPFTCFLIIPLYPAALINRRSLHLFIYTIYIASLKQFIS